MRMFLTLLLVGGLVAGCSLTGDDDDDSSDQNQSVRTVTSTPTSSDQEPSVAPTETQEDEAPTATVEPSPDPTATPSATQPEDAEATTPPEGEGNDEIQAEVDDIQSAMVDIRGLELLEDIDVEIIDRDQLQTRIQEIIAEEYSQEQAELDTLTYWLLRLVDDRDLDLYQLQIDLLGEQVAGYYDPETDELVVVTRDGQLAAIDKVTTAHEIVHALQDQHVDLVAFDEMTTNADAEAAMTSLIEGDASVAMTLYMFEALGPEDLAEVFAESLFQQESFDVLDNAPRYISESLVFPYNQGQAFVEQLFAQDEFDTIDAAFEDPPQSTEQILHPEKYMSDDRDEPVEVSLPNAAETLEDGWELVTEDALGEWDLRIMLDENGAENANEAAAGWGGSWFHVYQSENEAAVLLGTAWDSEADADEFESALAETFSEMDESGDLLTDGERFFTTYRADGHIYLVSGTSADAVSGVLDTIAN